MCGPVSRPRLVASPQFNAYMKGIALNHHIADHVSQGKRIPPRLLYLLYLANLAREKRLTGRARVQYAKLLRSTKGATCVR